MTGRLVASLEPSGPKEVVGEADMGAVWSDNSRTALGSHERVEKFERVGILDDFRAGVGWITKRFAWEMEFGGYDHVASRRQANF